MTWWCKDQRHQQLWYSFLFSPQNSVFKIRILFWLTFGPASYHDILLDLCKTYWTSICSLLQTSINIAGQKDKKVWIIAVPYQILVVRGGRWALFWRLISQINSFKVDLSTLYFHFPRTISLFFSNKDIWGHLRVSAELQPTWLLWR